MKNSSPDPNSFLFLSCFDLLLALICYTSFWRWLDILDVQEPKKKIISVSHCTMISSDISFLELKICKFVIVSQRWHLICGTKGIYLVKDTSFSLVRRRVHDFCRSFSSSSVSWTSILFLLMSIVIISPFWTRPIGPPSCIPINVSWKGFNLHLQLLKLMQVYYKHFFDILSANHEQFLDIRFGNVSWKSLSLAFVANLAVKITNLTLLMLHPLIVISERWLNILLN